MVYDQLNQIICLILSFVWYIHVWSFQAGLPLQLHTFPTGVMVLRGQGVSQEEEKQSMVWCQSMDSMSKQNVKTEVSWNIKVCFQCQYFAGESGWELWQLDTRRTRSDAEHERRSCQVCHFVFTSISTHYWFLKREVSERWNRGSSLQGRQCRGTQVIHRSISLFSLHGIEGYLFT